MLTHGRDLAWPSVSHLFGGLLQRPGLNADMFRMQTGHPDDMPLPQTGARTGRVWADTVRPMLVSALVVTLAIASVRGHGWVPLVSHVDLGIHELGHLLVAWTPPVGAAIAGSALQVLAPAALAAYFWFARRDASASTLLIAWLGVSLRNVSVYMADANARVLPLLGAQDGHDWAFVFGTWGVLDHAEGIARVVSASGLLAFAAAIALAVASFANPRVRARRDRDREARLATLPVREPRNRPPVA